MTRLLAISRGIDRFSDRLFSALSWLVLAMVLLGSFTAVGRYSGRSLGVDLTSNALTDLQWNFFAAVFLLGSAAALKNDAHVRVDVLFGRLGTRAQTWIDLVGTLVFLLPFCAFAIYVGLPSVFESWRVLEGSPDTGGLPRYPVKTLVPVAFALLFVQGLSELIKKTAMLRGALPMPGTEAVDE